MGETGEHALIAAFERLLTNRSGHVVRWVGDDAAVVLGRPVTVTSIDTTVDGVHVRLSDPRSRRPTPGTARWRRLCRTSPRWRAPGEAYVALGVPGDFGADAAVELVTAMEALAAQESTTICGGDVTWRRS